MICLKNSKNNKSNPNIDNAQETILKGLKFGLRGTEIANATGIKYSAISYRKRTFKKKGLLTLEDLCLARKYRIRIIELLKKGVSKSEIASSLGVPLEIVENLEGNYDSDIAKYEDKNTEEVEKKEKWGNAFSKLSEKMKGKLSIDTIFKNFLRYTKMLYRTTNLDKKDLEEAIKIIAKAMQRTNLSDLKIQSYQVLLALNIKLGRPNQALMYCNRVINEDFPEKIKAKFGDMRQQLIKAIKLERIMRQQRYCPSDAIALLAREEGLPEMEVREALRKYGPNIQNPLEDIEFDF